MSEIHAQEPVVAPVVPETVAESKTESTPLEATTNTTTETPVAATADATLPKEDELNKDEVKVTAEPVTKGVLGYKAPGLVSQFRFSKKYFWVGDEAVPTKDLHQYLRGEKPEVAHPTAAWSSQTGKGLLYFSKTAENITTPAGVIALADISEVAKEGTVDFSFKYAHHKHTFQAKDTKERDGWLVTLESEAEKAVASRESVTTGDSYKESLAHLKNPAIVGGAAGLAAGAATADHKKSTDIPTVVRDNASGSSSDEGKKRSKSKSKSRSVSRNKRASVFGSLLGKKEEHEEKKEIKKEETSELKAGEPVAVAVPETTTEATAETTTTTAEPIAFTDVTKDVQATNETPVIPAAAPVEETTPTKDVTKGTTATSKSNKRNSIFGNFFQKVGSPTSEKKEPELAPVVAPKEDATTPKTVEPLTTAPETTEAVPEPTPVAEPVVATNETSTLETKPEVEPTATENTTATPATEPPALDKRRPSFFGLGGKKEKTADTTPHAFVEPPAANTTTEASEHPKENKFSLGNIFRRPSQLLKSDKKKKEETTHAPTTVPETEAETVAEPKVADETATTEKPTAAVPETATSTEQSAIGDVVPDAVTVGEAPTPAAPQPVSATA